MGNRCIVSSQRWSSGVDSTAYKDERPLQIVVQIKSQDKDIKKTAIHSLRSTICEGDYGLFVTLSNYTKNSKRTLIISGINGSEFVDLGLKYYDQLSEKYRKMISLKMEYIPVSEEK